MAEVFTFEIDLGALQRVAEPFGMIEWRWAADVITKEVVKRCLKSRVVFCLEVFRFKIGGIFDECFRDKLDSETDEMSVGIGRGLIRGHHGMKKS